MSVANYIDMVERTDKNTASFLQEIKTLKALYADNAISYDDIDRIIEQIKQSTVLILNILESDIISEL